MPVELAAAKADIAAMPASQPASEPVIRTTTQAKPSFYLQADSHERRGVAKRKKKEKCKRRSSCFLILG